MTPPGVTAEFVAEKLRQHIDADGFAHLRFDVDGTVAELRVYPDESQPNPVAFGAYERLLRVPGLQVGAITGRGLDFASSIFPEPFELDCSYGMESRHAGVVWQHPGIIEWTPVIRRFTDRVVAQAAVMNIPTVFFAREAADTDAIYIERKPAGTGLHDAPARSTNTATPISQLMIDLIDALDEDFDGLVRHDNSGNIEFSAPLESSDGAVVNKGTVIDALAGFIVFSADDTGDLPAVRKIKERGGIVLAVNNKPDALRRGSPPELLELADAVFDDVEAHAHFIAAIADQLS